MPKRSAEEKLIRYNKKIQILEGKIKKRRQRSIIYSDEEDDAQVSKNVEQSHTPLPPIPTVSAGMTVQDVTDNEVTEIPNTQEVIEFPVEPLEELNPELISALGVSCSDSPEFGNRIHETLASLWSPLLKKGLSQEEKQKLIKEFIVPENCKNLQAPKLNAEISAAITDLARARDKKISSFQQQLGYGMTAINRAMDFLLTKEENKVSVLKCLSDGCRILSDLHVALTKDRVKLILPGLDTNFKHIIQDSDRDETLFGNDLSEKIKASKAIEKQGAQIKKLGSKVPVSQPTATRSTQQGNWVGPPRYPSNRGGRGGQRNGPMGTPAQRRPYPNTASNAKFTQSRPRAPTQH